MNTEIQEKLEKMALKRSIPFCYGCYHEAPTGRCKTCGSDDLMLSMPGIGCEYGSDWVIKAILEAELTPFDLDKAFEDHIRECYPETTQVGWMNLDTVSTMKEIDPVSWNIAQSEWESFEADEETIISFDNGLTYYYTSDIETLLEDED